MVVDGGVTIGVVVGVAAGNCPLAMASRRPKQVNARINVSEAICCCEKLVRSLGVYRNFERKKGVVEVKSVVKC